MVFDEISLVCTTLIGRRATGFCPLSRDRTPAGFSFSFFFPFFCCCCCCLFSFYSSINGFVGSYLAIRFGRMDQHRCVLALRIRSHPSAGRDVIEWLVCVGGASLVAEPIGQQHRRRWTTPIGRRRPWERTRQPLTEFFF